MRRHKNLHLNAVSELLTPHGTNLASSNNINILGVDPEIGIQKLSKFPGLTSCTPAMFVFLRIFLSKSGEGE